MEPHQVVRMRSRKLTGSIAERPPGAGSTGPRWRVRGRNGSESLERRTRRSWRVFPRKWSSRAGKGALEMTALHITRQVLFVGSRAAQAVTWRRSRVGAVGRRPSRPLR